jgi:hypothetical protein
VVPNPEGDRETKPISWQIARKCRWQTQKDCMQGLCKEMKGPEGLRKRVDGKPSWLP